MIAGAEGLVVCEPRHEALLDETLVFSLAGGRLSWPWRWARGTATAPVITDPDEIDHPEIKGLWKVYLAQNTPDPTDAFTTLVLADHTDNSLIQRMTWGSKLETATFRTKPLNEYHAPNPLTGEEITAAALERWLGQPVLFSESSRPRTPHLVVISSVRNSRFDYFYRDPNGAGGTGTKDLNELRWIGEAKWCGPP